MRGSAAGRRRSPQPGRAAHRSMGDERERVRYMRRCGPRGADRRGGRGCVPGQPAGLREVVRGAPLRQGRPKGAGEPQAPVGCRGYPHARLCRRATVVAAAAEAAHRSSVMSGSEWTRAEMRSAWSGPGRGPGKCPRAACLPGRGGQGSPCKLPRSQPRGSFAAVPFEHERRRARANKRRHDCCLHAAARRARSDRRPVAGKACGGSQAGAVAPEAGSARVCPSLCRCVNRRC